MRVDAMSADDIKKRVVAWIDGKHSRIGIISSENKDDTENVKKLYRTLVEVTINQAKRDAAKK